ncbi:MAG: acyl-ACP desaturase [Acidimicrobiales bacterium]|nr:acyl-ACP desaturase [Acidimicrobiales bacterium]
MTSSLELFRTVEGEIATLMADHRERREHWYHHEVVPWELGRNYVDEPWDESQCTLSPEVRTALHVNLLTEDNLPYYHARLATCFPADSPMANWGRLWTAEEGQHAIAMRSYLLVSRNCNPKELEDERMTVVERGWRTALEDPIDIFVYTSAQELATRISHRNAGAHADDETAFNLMKKIAADENHHFIFYKGVVTAMLKEDPSQVITSMWRTLADFEMPGTTIPRFVRRSIGMAKLGIYNLRIHADKVVSPLLREWQIDQLGGLTADAAEAQDNLMELPSKLIEAAELFEARMEKTERRSSRTSA